MSDENGAKPQKKRGGDRLMKSEKLEKRPKVQRTGRELILHRVYVALTAVSAVIVALFVLYNILVVKPTVGGRTEKDPAAPGATEDVTQAPNHVKGDDGDRKEDFFTFLVVGRDTGGGGNTDTIMLVSYDVPNQKLSVMSIPRDTMVNIPYDIKRINAVYNYYGGGEDGIDALYKEVSQLVGFRPDFEVVIEWAGVGELVDAIGGVDFEVPMRMRYYDPTQNLNIDLQKGYQHLDGDKAMQLIRFRHNNDLSVGYADGDIGRIATQQAFLKTVIQKCLSSITDIGTITRLVGVFLDNVQTDLTVNNLLYFGEKAILGGLSMDKVTFVTMPGDYNGYAWSRTYQNNQSYVLPYADEVIGVVNEYFNPFLEELTTEHLDIMSVNSNGSLSSTTGVVEDAKAARAPVKPSKPSKPASSPAVEPVESVEPQETGTVEPSPVPSESAAPSQSPSGGPGGPGSTVSPGVSPSQPPAESASPEPSPTPSERPGVLPPVPTPVETGSAGSGGGQPPEGIPIY